MWAGVECTLNRVGDEYVNQCEKNGHLTRPQDLDLFAGLGAERIRYPCLWEMVSPDTPDCLDWSWLDERLLKIRELGMQPIAGLLHHGSGPRFTSLNDPQFPEKFAAYARDFAERYPWIEDYTPINEPLTTARFSCLYGHWYPHLSDDREFVRAMFNQIRGTILAMREIRKVNPGARLIQTEDLGRAQSTPLLQYQADFENARRWVSYDLLCGRTSSGNKRFDQYLKTHGLTEQERAWLQSHACPPDIIGINHYLLSNRFLDHRLELHPPAFHGGNGLHRYADVGAVDTELVETPAPESVFFEAWERYKIPLAVTEVHVRGHRESQLRWLKTIWNCALKLRKKGVDFRAVTAWSLLGTYDWDSLCTRSSMFYEPGVFDLRAKKTPPRATALSGLIRTLSTTGECDHPVFTQSRPLLITGATGTLGRAFARVCQLREIPYRIVSRAQMDITDVGSIRKVFDEIQPWAVINTAGYVKVDEAEGDQERCFRENVRGALTLAQACAEKHLPFVTFSSDLVFDGRHSQAYTESHPTSPLNVYGRSKAQCEEQVLKAHPDSMIIRTSSFFGPWDEYNFVTQALRQLRRKETLTVPCDIRVSPTYVPDLVHSSLDLLFDRERGLIHLTNEGGLTWSELARAAVKRSSGIDGGLIHERPAKEFGFTASRPKNSVLVSERVKILPSVEDALDRYFLQVETLA